MVINNCTMNDDAAYAVAAGEDKCTTELFVKGNVIKCLKLNLSRLQTHLHARWTMLSSVLLPCPAELPVKIIKGIEPVKTTVNERIELECEVSEDGAQVKW